MIKFFGKPKKMAAESDDTLRIQCLSNPSSKYREAGCQVHYNSYLGSFCNKIISCRIIIGFILLMGVYIWLWRLLSGWEVLCWSKSRSRLPRTTLIPSTREFNRLVLNVVWLDSKNIGWLFVLQQYWSPIQSAGQDSKESPWDNIRLRHYPGCSENQTLLGTYYCRRASFQF